jgi:pyruvate dehydrogenase E2 component (dihydrolipoamide acetyltransferase)
MRQLPLLIVSFAVLLAAAGCHSEDGTEAKKTETPKTEAPKAEAPKTDTPAATASTASFTTKTAPLLNKYCTPCHAGAGAKAGLDVTAIKTDDDAKAAKDKLAKAAEEVESKKMPPAKSANQPTDAERADMVAGLRSV